MKTKLPLCTWLLFSLLAVTARTADAPLVVAVWPGDAPGSEGRSGDEKVRMAQHGEHVVSNIHRPSLTVYLPPKEQATGAAVVICPGGGHRELWMDHEGHAIGEWLAAHGIAGLVLKYRLAREEGSTYQVDVHALADAQRAIRLARHRAAEWNLDPARIGIIGFSAGGELAGLAARKFDAGAPAAADPVDRESARPAFQGLIYPGNAKTIVPVKDAPPAFLVCGYNDRPDISEGLAQVYLAFKQAGISAELHIFAGAGHGFDLRPTNTGPAAAWPERFREWLDDRGFLARAK